LSASSAKQDENAENVSRLFRAIPTKAVAVAIQSITNNVGRTELKYVINARPFKVTLN
jgi:hypothetical protein